MTSRKVWSQEVADRAMDLSGPNKVLSRKTRSLLSLSQKAGKLLSGERGCEKALRSGDAKLVLIAEDASDNTKKKFLQKTFYYGVDCLTTGTKSDLGGSIGKESTASIALTDLELAKQILKTIDQETEVG